MKMPNCYSQLEGPFSEWGDPIERVLSVNDLHLVSIGVVEAARDSLVIGPDDTDYAK
jgi:hypothetical protein